MKVGNSHLTYCTNIHAGESWADVRANLERHVLAVKQRVCPDRPFGVGLRLSNAAAHELHHRLDGTSLVPELKRFLDDHGLYVFTINGFPYGTFHGEPVKESVYDPDWRHEQPIRGDSSNTFSPRSSYTVCLIEILGALLPEGVTGSISTLPGALRVGPGDIEHIVRRLAYITWHLWSYEERFGKRIVLALEPEPCCMLETIAETIAFFDKFTVNERQDLGSRVPDRRYLGICLDACHAAVEFEDVRTALSELRAHDVSVAKVQLSCGLRIAPVDAAARAELARFDDAVYLHQVVARRGRQLVRYLDAPLALADPAPADEWRVHFHVPIFREALGAFSSTQPFLAELLAEHRRAEISPHLEVETYTWDVLPAEFRDEPIADAVARELRWVMERL